MSGVSKNFEKSTAQSDGTSKGAINSAGLQVKWLGLSSEHEHNTLNEISSGVNAAVSQSYETTDLLSYTVAPNSCAELRQIQVTQDDTVTGAEGIEFRTYSIWMFKCELTSTSA